MTRANGSLKPCFVRREKGSGKSLGEAHLATLQIETHVASVESIYEYRHDIWGAWRSAIRFFFLGGGGSNGIFAICAWSRVSMK